MQFLSINYSGFRAPQQKISQVNKPPPKNNQIQPIGNHQAPVQKKSHNSSPKVNQQSSVVTKNIKPANMAKRSIQSAVPLRTPSKMTQINHQQTKSLAKVSSNTSVDAKKRSLEKLLSQTPSNARSSKNLLRLNNVNVSRDVYDPLGVLRDEVNKAIRENKTFTIRGNFAVIRRALLRRGWIEKIHFSYRDRMNEELKKYQTYKINDLLELIKNKDIGEVCKKLIRSKLLSDHQVDLYWSFNTESFKECPINIKSTKFNKFRWDAFTYTSKQGEYKVIES